VILRMLIVLPSLSVMAVVAMKLEQSIWRDVTAGLPGITAVPVTARAQLLAKQPAPRPLTPWKPSARTDEIVAATRAAMKCILAIMMEDVVVGKACITKVGR